MSAKIFIDVKLYVAATKGLNCFYKLIFEMMNFYAEIKYRIDYFYVFLLNRKAFCKHGCPINTF